MPSQLVGQYRNQDSLLTIYSNGQFWHDTTTGVLSARDGQVQLATMGECDGQISRYVMMAAGTSELRISATDDPCPERKDHPLSGTWKRLE